MDANKNNPAAELDLSKLLGFDRLAQVQGQSGQLDHAMGALFNKAGEVPGKIEGAMSALFNKAGEGPVEMGRAMGALFNKTGEAPPPAS